MPTSLEYDVVDVFTAAPFAGNPLAVVHGAEELCDAQLHALAREFNLSETTFPVPSGEPASYSVRIFTPGGEIPFAGHPTLGTAWVLRRRGEIGAGRVVQHCGAGEVEVSVPDDERDAPELAARPRDLPVDVAPDGLLDALALAPGDLAGPVLAAGCGLTFVHVPVHPDALVRARCPRPGDVTLEGLPGVADPVGGIDVYAAAGSAPVRVRCRVFCPDVAVPEDPATGSSAAGLGLVLQHRGVLADDGRFQVTQGVEIQRPSRLLGRVQVSGGRVRRCRVAGGVAHAASGRIAVPPARGTSTGVPPRRV